MAKSTFDVIAAVHAAFPSGEAEAILALLDRYGTEPHELERARVQVAIVELSGGKREKLEELIKVAKLDYRDILAWQQMGPLPAEKGEKLQKEAKGLIDRWGKK